MKLDYRPARDPVTRIFYTFRDAPQRRRALAAPVGAAERYALFGLDELRARGHLVRHNLEREGRPPTWARAAGSAIKRTLERAGGYGGDFDTVLAALRAANRAQVVLSTVDTVGIPLVLLERAGRVRPPLVYVAIGLPERLARLRNDRMRRLYAESLGRAACVLAYSELEAEELRAWTAARGVSTNVEFVPFGVDEQAFAPAGTAAAFDVVTIGADPHRDLGLLLAVAGRMPTRSFRIVTTRDGARGLGEVPANVDVEVDLPFDTMRARLAGARVVALPVRDNSYSGATTVLLQAMASAKPVVVSRTRAIEGGYDLVDGENCRLVAPGDVEGFGRALGSLLADEPAAAALGARARALVERALTWSRYVDRIERIVELAVRA